MDHLIIWDFDWSLLDGSSSYRLIYDSNEKTKKHVQINKSMEWTKLMNECVLILSNELYTLDMIDNLLKNAPITNQKSVKFLTENKLEQIIVSDSNYYNISTILKHHNLIDQFKHIVTNPIVINDSSTFTIYPLHDESNPHNCKICTDNHKTSNKTSLCKTKALEDLYKNKPSKKIIYIGDGTNDFCPIINYLTEDDICLCRNNYSLHRNINEYSDKIKPKILIWNNSDDIFNILQKIINK
jgi:pyridoxal phosphate phosphatase PHOSPHO2